MTETERLVAALAKEKTPEAELSRFANRMTAVAWRLAGMQLAFRLAGMPEKPDDLPVLKRLEERMYRLLSAGNSPEFSGTAMEKQAAALLALRTDCAELMKEAFRLAELHDLAEHVANRAEAGVFPERFGALPSDEEIAAQAYRYVAGSGSEGTGLRMQALQAQLPMRLARAKFLDHVHGVFALYAGQEGQTLTDFSEELLQTAGLIPAAPGMALAAEEEKTVREVFLENTGELTPEAFERGSQALAVCASRAHAAMERLPDVSGAAGLMLIRLLAGPYVLTPEASDETVAALLVSLSEGARPDETAGAFEKLEGLDIDLLTEWQAGAAALPDIRREHRLLADSLMLGPQFANLARFDAWLTGGDFADPDQTRDIRPLEKADIAAAFSAFEQALTPYLTGLPRKVRRSVMARIMGKLPPFAVSTQAVRQYLRSSIAFCTDETEKKGFVSVLRILTET